MTCVVLEGIDSKHMVFIEHIKAFKTGKCCVLFLIDLLFCIKWYAMLQPYFSFSFLTWKKRQDAAESNKLHPQILSDYQTNFPLSCNIAPDA